MKLHSRIVKHDKVPEISRHLYDNYAVISEVCKNAMNMWTNQKMVSSNSLDVPLL